MNERRVIDAVSVSEGIPLIAKYAMSGAAGESKRLCLGRHAKYHIAIEGPLLGRGHGYSAGGRSGGNIG